MSTNIVLTFDNEMTDPVGKHGEFSAEFSNYQSWASYDDTPVLTSDYPYQYVYNDGSFTFLFVSTNPFYADSQNIDTISPSTADTKRYYYSGGWVYLDNPVGVGTGGAFSSYEANTDIYTDETLTSVYFTQTTSPTTPLTLTAIALDTDITRYNLTVSETVASTDTVTVSYTKGTVTNAYGVSLESFTDFDVRGIIAATIQSASVINDGGTGLITMVFDEDMANPSGKESEFSASIGVESLYQEWENYPDSPVLTSEAPKQVIVSRDSDSSIILYYNRTTIDAPLYIDSSNPSFPRVYTFSMRRFLVGGAWGTPTAVDNYFTTLYTELEANTDIYTDNTLTSIDFAQTTTDTTPLTITDIYLDANIKQYKMTLAEEILSTDTITIGYTQGTVQSASGGVLNEFSDFSVTNNV